MRPLALGAASPLDGLGTPSLAEGPGCDRNPDVSGLLFQDL